MAEHVLKPHEHAWLNELRAWRRHKPKAPEGPHQTASDRLADLVAATVGSWRFVIIQSALLITWLILNGSGVIDWDPFPFILLNLLLSFQAAYTAPIIMMSQNRQGDVDRGRANEDYKVNIKAELEIELLHQKIDLMREQEIAQLSAIVRELLQKLEQRG